MRISSGRGGSWILDFLRNVDGEDYGLCWDGHKEASVVMSGICAVHGLETGLFERRHACDTDYLPGTICGLRKVR